jgi:hypothetical protein
MSDGVVEELRKRRVQTWRKMKELLECQGKESRTLTAEEEAQWQILNDQIDKIEARLEEIKADENADQESD